MSTQLVMTYLEVRELLLYLGSFLSISLQFFLETFLTPISSLLVHSLIDVVVDLISFLVVLVIRVLCAQAAAVPFKLTS